MSTHNMPFINIRKENHPRLSKSMSFFSQGLKNEFETAMVNEPSVFEPLKFYCILHNIREYFEISMFEIRRGRCCGFYF